jgi:hypothetical protein
LTIQAFTRHPEQWNRSQKLISLLTFQFFYTKISVNLKGNQYT